VPTLEHNSLSIFNHKLINISKKKLNRKTKISLEKLIYYVKTTTAPSRKKLNKNLYRIP
jgi:hypothetical protein